MLNRRAKSLGCLFLRKHVVLGAGRTTRIWNSKRWALALYSFGGHVGYVSSVCCSPDGKGIVPGPGDKTIRICDGNDGKPVCELIKAHESIWIRVDFSHNLSPGLLIREFF